MTPDFQQPQGGGRREQKRQWIEQSAEELQTLVTARLVKVTCQPRWKLKHLADDITQSTLLRGLENVDKILAATSDIVLAWLNRTAVNLIVEHFRNSTPSILPEDMFAAIPCPRLARESELSLIKELHSDILIVLGEFSEEKQMAFMLRYDANMTFKEIASRLDRCPETISRWCSAMRTFIVDRVMANFVEKKPW
jgi:RNA polymerase sigma factor (sigma-70 family)